MDTFDTVICFNNNLIISLTQPFALASDVNILMRSGKSCGLATQASKHEVTKQ